MKLATLRDGTRDGRLVVVSRDLTRASDARHIAPTLQFALDHWEKVAPHLELIARGVETGGQPTERFHERAAASPLPRACQWACGAAYLNHVELLARARGAAMPADLRAGPLIWQGGSDGFLDPRAPIRADPASGIDLAAGIAVVTGDVAVGAGRATAAAAIRLVMLVNAVALRHRIPTELAKGFGFYQSRPAAAFSPIAVTPDELDGRWDGERLQGALLVDLNGRPFGRLDPGADISFGFPALIEHATRTRAAAAGSIFGAGTVSNREDAGPARPVAEGGRGYASIAERRAIETLAAGAAVTPYLVPGDTLRIEMRDGAGHSIFGAIEQAVEALPAPD